MIFLSGLILFVNYFFILIKYSLCYNSYIFLFFRGGDQRIRMRDAKKAYITNDGPYRRIFHSDQGWAYRMKAYVSTLKENKIFQSMSRKGNCHDNCIMENFFGIMKQLSVG